MTLLFVVPVKSRRHSRDWGRACGFLNGTLHSIAAQTSGSCHTMLVCTEPPDLDRDYERVTVLESDIRIEGEYDSRKGRMDKQRKVLRGLLEGQPLAPDYAMVVDADDLIHRDLVRHVEDHGGRDAFIVDKGYRYQLGTDRLRKSQNYHMISGSSMIFPYRSGDFVGVRSDREVDVHYMTRAAHPKPVERIFADQGIGFRYIPFYAGIYLRGHNDSLRDLSAEEIRRGAIKIPLSRGYIRKRVSGMAWKAYGRLFGTRRVDESIVRDFFGSSARPSDSGNTA